MDEFVDAIIRPDIVMASLMDIDYMAKSVCQLPDSNKNHTEQDSRILIWFVEMSTPVNYTTSGAGEPTKVRYKWLSEVPRYSSEQYPDQYTTDEENKGGLYYRIFVKEPVMTSKRHFFITMFYDYLNSCVSKELALPEPDFFREFEDMNLTITPLKMSNLSRIVFSMIGKPRVTPFTMDDPADFLDYNWRLFDIGSWHWRVFSDRVRNDSRSKTIYTWKTHSDLFYHRSILNAYYQSLVDGTESSKSIRLKGELMYLNILSKRSHLDLLSKRIPSIMLSKRRESYVALGQPESVLSESRSTYSASMDCFINKFGNELIFDNTSLEIRYKFSLQTHEGIFKISDFHGYLPGNDKYIEYYGQCKEIINVVKDIVELSSSQNLKSM